MRKDLEIKQNDEKVEYTVKFFIGNGHWQMIDEGENRFTLEILEFNADLKIKRNFDIELELSNQNFGL